MEPTPSPQPEQTPPQPAAAPEATPQPSTQERPAAAPEATPQPASRPERSAGLPPVPPPTTPPPPPPQTTTPADGLTDTAVPAAADDVDLIEKEWVNRAKQVIDTTKDDPHAQEAGFEELQIEYQKKRYGRSIKPAH